MIKENISFPDYLGIDALNASTAVHGLESMLQLKYVLDNPSLDKAEVRIGTALHSLAEIGSVERFLDEYVVMPDFANHPDNVTGKGERSFASSTSWCKLMVEDFMHENGGKQVIQQSDYDKVRGMLAAIESKPFAKHLMDSAMREVTVLANLYGVPCKIRFDGLAVGAYDAVAWDIKTTASSIEKKQFGRVVSRLNYLFKLQFYRMVADASGIKVDELYLITVSQKAPHDCAVVPVPVEAMESERENVKRIILEFVECGKTKVWPGVDRGEPLYELDTYYPGMDSVFDALEQFTMED